MRGELETTCARCLEPAQVAVDVPLAVTFVSDRGRQDAATTRTRTSIAFQGGEIDVGDELRDEILLALPINPLCKESCRGLCPVCGGNRNVDRLRLQGRRRRRRGAFAALGKMKLSNSH